MPNPVITVESARTPETVTQAQVSSHKEPAFSTFTHPAPIDDRSHVTDKTRRSSASQYSHPVGTDISRRSSTYSLPAGTEAANFYPRRSSAVSHSGRHEPPRISDVSCITTTKDKDDSIKYPSVDKSGSVPHDSTATHDLEKTDDAVQDENEEAVIHERPKDTAPEQHEPSVSETVPQTSALDVQKTSDDSSIPCAQRSPTRPVARTSSSSSYKASESLFSASEKESPPVHKHRSTTSSSSLAHSEPLFTDSSTAPTFKEPAAKKRRVKKSSETTTSGQFYAFLLLILESIIEVSIDFEKRLLVSLTILTI